MGNLLQTTLPVFGLILLGYVVGWAGVIDRAGIRGLSRFTFRIAIPVLLVRSMANVALSGPVEWPLMAAYYGATLVMYAAGMGAGRWIFSQPLEQQAIFGLGASFSNLVVLGLPIVLVVYGNEGELPMYMILSCNAAVLFFLASSVQGIARGVTQPRQGLSFIVLKTHATNPVIVRTRHRARAQPARIPYSGALGCDCCDVGFCRTSLRVVHGGSIAEPIPTGWRTPRKRWDSFC